MLFRSLAGGATGATLRELLAESPGVRDELVHISGTTRRTVAIVDSSSGESLHLTRTEWQLLEALVRHPGALITQRQLLQQVWGPTYATETQYLRQYLAQLRRKLEPDPSRPRHLLTEPGMGYRFQPQEQDPAVTADGSTGDTIGTM